MSVGCAAMAMEQIKTKAHYQQYQAQWKKIILLGIGISQENRNIADFSIPCK